MVIESRKLKRKFEKMEAQLEACFFQEAPTETIDEDSSAQELLCRRSNLWGDNTPYFDLCAAGLGMKETEMRRTLVKEGRCKTSPDKRPAQWELAQLAQCTLRPIEPPLRWQS